MAYIAPSTRSAGALITAAIWNQDVVANPIAIYAGAMSMASQAANEVPYASSATQLTRSDALTFNGAKLTVKSSIAGGAIAMQIENTNADALGDQFTFFKNSASPAVNDELGYLDFRGKDSGGNTTDYAYLKVVTNGVTDTAESALWRFYTVNAGVFDFLVLQITEAGLHRMPAYGAGTATFDASGNITSVSDERLKDIQGKFRAGLNAVLGVQPILYRWAAATGFDTENVYAGFSAQNVLQYIPEAVGKNLKGEYSVNTASLLAALVTAIQELTGEVDTLRAAAGLPVIDRVAIPLVGDDRAMSSARASVVNAATMVKKE